MKGQYRPFLGVSTPVKRLYARDSGKHGTKSSCTDGWCAVVLDPLRNSRSGEGGVGFTL